MHPLILFGLLLALSTQGSFVWAIRRFFVAAGGMQPGMRAIAGAGAICLGVHLAAIVWRLADPTPPGPWSGLGLALYGTALQLFWAAVMANRERPLTLAFSEDTPQHLVQWGPYRRIRHPFYSAYLLAWLGGAAVSEQPLLLLTAALMGGLYVRAARAEEEKFARSPLAPAYAVYRARTGMFLPSVIRA